MTLLSAAIIWLPTGGVAQNISLEALRGSGYGVVELKRPRPNVLTVTAEIDGRKVRLPRGDAARHRFLSRGGGSAVGE
ncbi:MAG: hypothetical protein H0V56_04450 [Chthoniobacterales bacterium]|nr:hypothetical protein [Chthoniobacterales bacterium]